MVSASLVSVDGNTRNKPARAENPNLSKLRSLCESHETTPDDFLLIGERGVLGNPSPATAKRVYQLAERMGERCIWTCVDCVRIVRTAAKVGEKDDALLSPAETARLLGTTEDRVAKWTRIGNRFPTAEDRFIGASATHHEEVACLIPHAARAILQRAVDEHLPVSAVRELVSAKRHDDPDSLLTPSKGRKPRTPGTGNAGKANGSAVDPMLGVGTVVDVHTGAPAGKSARYVPDPDPAPAGKAPAPSQTVGISARITLMDRDLSGQLLAKCANNLPAAESLLAEIVRAYLAAN